MNVELSFAIIWSDISLLEIEFRAANGRFAGATTFYISPDSSELTELIRRIQGYPKKLDQIEEFRFGSSELSLKFICIDGLGHAAVDINITEGRWIRESAQRKAFFELPFEPAQLDQFVDELSELIAHKNGKATLKGLLIEDYQ
jgi:hypothetical protein